MAAGEGFVCDWASICSVSVPAKHQLFSCNCEDLGGEATVKEVLGTCLLRAVWSFSVTRCPSCFCARVSCSLLWLFSATCTCMPTFSLSDRLLSSWQVIEWLSSPASQEKRMSSAKLAAITCPQPSFSARRLPTMGTCAATTSTVPATATSQSLRPLRSNRYSPGGIAEAIALGPFECHSERSLLEHNIFIAFWSVTNTYKAWMVATLQTTLQRVYQSGVAIPPGARHKQTFQACFLGCRCCFTL